MRKRVRKVILLFIILIMLLQINSFATFRPSDIDGDVSLNSSESEEKLNEFANQILGFIDVGGTVLAIVIITIIGIQYMKSSVEQKAQYKEKLIPYAVGCVLLVAAPKIARIIYNIANNIH